jgi:predicted NACHT family NTPase
MNKLQPFIQQWHDRTFPEGLDKTRKQERLHKSIQDSKAIRELAGNPLLLTMMAILNRNQELPRDRPELYNQASRVLLHQWDVEAKLLQDPTLKDFKITIDDRDKQAMLRKVAYHMQANQQGLAGNIIGRDDLERILTDYLQTLAGTQARSVARLMIEQLRSRNFMLCYLGADTYAFVHRTFLEYFCAWEFVWQFEKERAIDLDYLKQQVFLPHYQDERWHEVLSLICGMIDSRFVAEIVEFLMALPVDRTKVEKHFPHEPLVKAAYAHLLLAADLIGEARNQNSVAAISVALLQVLKQQLDTEKFGFFSDVPAAIVHAIATVWKDDPDTLPWLKSRAQSDEDEGVRYVAVQALACDFKDHPDMAEFFYDRALHDPFVRAEDGQSNPRQTALEALVEHYPDHPQTSAALRDRATHDPDETVREFAQQQLAALQRSS